MLIMVMYTGKFITLVSCLIVLAVSSQPIDRSSVRIPIAKNPDDQSHCSTCRGPIHSWRTFPVSFHCSRPNTRGPTGLEWLPEDLEALGRYPLITLEKWHATAAFSTDICQQTGNCESSGNVFAWLQDAWVSAAQQIKEKYPNTSVAVWMDTMLIYTGWTWPPTGNKATEDTINRTLNPDIKVPCSTGYFRPAEFLEGHDAYLLKNSSGLKAQEPWSGCHIYDHTKPFVRKYWTDLCLNMTASGYIDGCGADFSALEQNRWSAHTTDKIAQELGLDMETAQRWNEGHRQVMMDTTKALRNGFLIGKDSFELGDHVNAVLQEGCPPRNSTITMLRNLTDTARALNKRLIYQCRGSTSESAMAAFLCGAGPDHYFLVGGWINDVPGFPSHWNPAFEKPLGPPLSDAMYDSESTSWSRKFASGTFARFDASTNVGTIEWSEQQEHPPIDLSLATFQ